MPRDTSGSNDNDNDQSEDKLMLSSTDTVSNSNKICKVWGDRWKIMLLNWKEREFSNIVDDLITNFLGQ